MPLPTWRDTLLDLGLTASSLVNNLPMNDLVYGCRDLWTHLTRYRRTPPTTQPHPFAAALSSLPDTYQAFYDLVMPIRSACVPVPCIVTGPRCVFVCHRDERNTPVEKKRRVRGMTVIDNAGVLSWHVEAVRQYLYANGYHGEVIGVRVRTGAAHPTEHPSRATLAESLRHHRPAYRSQTPGWAVLLLRAREITTQPLPLPAYHMRDQLNRVGTLQPMHGLAQQVLQQLIDTQQNTSKKDTPSTQDKE
ncbi:MAG: hypothetical protein V3U84_06280 [Thiotrichaceae bacterium]